MKTKFCLLLQDNANEACPSHLQWQQHKYYGIKPVWIHN